jgi:hypothetical protein
LTSQHSAWVHVAPVHWIDVGVAFSDELPEQVKLAEQYARVSQHSATVHEA